MKSKSEGINQKQPAMRTDMKIEKGLKVLVKIGDRMVSDTVSSIQKHGVYCEDCRLVGIDQIFPATPESIMELDIMDPRKMIVAGDKLCEFYGDIFERME